MPMWAVSSHISGATNLTSNGNKANRAITPSATKYGVSLLFIAHDPGRFENENQDHQPETHEVAGLGPQQTAPEGID